MTWLSLAALLGTAALSHAAKQLPGGHPDIVAAASSGLSLAATLGIVGLGLLAATWIAVSLFVPRHTLPTWLRRVVPDWTLHGERLLAAVRWRNIPQGMGWLTGVGVLTIVLDQGAKWWVRSLAPGFVQEIVSQVGPLKLLLHTLMNPTYDEGFVGPFLRELAPAFAIQPVLHVAWTFEMLSTKLLVLAPLAWHFRERLAQRIASSALFAIGAGLLVGGMLGSMVDFLWWGGVWDWFGLRVVLSGRDPISVASMNIADAAQWLAVPVLASAILLSLRQRAPIPQPPSPSLASLSLLRTQTTALSLEALVAAIALHLLVLTHGFAGHRAMLGNQVALLLLRVDEARLATFGETFTTGPRRASDEYVEHTFKGPYRVMKDLVRQKTSAFRIFLPYPLETLPRAPVVPKGGHFVLDNAVLDRARWGGVGPPPPGADSFIRDVDEYVDSEMEPFWAIAVRAEGIVHAIESRGWPGWKQAFASTQHAITALAFLAVAEHIGGQGYEPWTRQLIEKFDRLRKARGQAVIKVEPEEYWQEAPFRWTRDFWQQVLEARRASGAQIPPALEWATLQEMAMDRLLQNIRVELIDEPISPALQAMLVTPSPEDALRARVQQQAEALHQRFVAPSPTLPATTEHVFVVDLIESPPTEAAAAPPSQPQPVAATDSTLQWPVLRIPRTFASPEVVEEVRQYLRQTLHETLKEAERIHAQETAGSSSNPAGAPQPPKSQGESSRSSQTLRTLLLAGSLTLLGLTSLVQAGERIHGESHEVIAAASAGLGLAATLGIVGLGLLAAAWLVAALFVPRNALPTWLQRFVLDWTAAGRAVRQFFRQHTSDALSATSSRCVTADTLLAVAESGRRGSECQRREVPIIDVTPGMLVYSLNEATGRIEPHRIKGLLRMGVKPVYRLTTASGHSIRTTGNHPYLTRRGWQQVGELGVGEEIAVPTREALSRLSQRVDRTFDDRVGNKQTTSMIQPLQCLFGPVEREPLAPHRVDDEPNRPVDFQMKALRDDSGRQVIREQNAGSMAEGNVQAIDLPLVQAGAPSEGLDGVMQGETPRHDRDVRPMVEGAQMATPRMSGDFTDNTGGNQETGELLEERQAVDPVQVDERTGIDDPFIHPRGPRRRPAGSPGLAAQRREPPPRRPAGWPSVEGASFADTGQAPTLDRGWPSPLPALLQLPRPVARVADVRVLQVAPRWSVAWPPPDAPEYSTRFVARSKEEVRQIDWDPIVAIEPVGTEPVYDIEVEGTHNFVANGILAHNTSLDAPADATVRARAWMPWLSLATLLGTAALSHAAEQLPSSHHKVMAAASSGLSLAATLGLSGLLLVAAAWLATALFVPRNALPTWLHRVVPDWTAAGRAVRQLLRQDRAITSGTDISTTGAGEAQQEPPRPPIRSPARVLITNGVENANAAALPPYMAMFHQALARQLSVPIVEQPMFESRRITGPSLWHRELRRAIDVLNYVFRRSRLVADLIQQTDRDEALTTSPTAVVAYSAGAEVWLRALAQRPTYQVETLMVIDGTLMSRLPSLRDHPHLKKIVLVHGQHSWIPRWVRLTPERLRSALSPTVEVIEHRIPISHLVFDRPAEWQQVVDAVIRELRDGPHAPGTGESPEDEERRDRLTSCSACVWDPTKTAQVVPDLLGEVQAAAAQFDTVPPALEHLAVRLEWRAPTEYTPQQREEAVTSLEPFLQDAAARAPPESLHQQLLLAVPNFLRTLLPHVPMRRAAVAQAAQQLAGQLTAAQLAFLEREPSLTATLLGAKPAYYSVLQDIALVEGITHQPAFELLGLRILPIYHPVDAKLLNYFLYRPADVSEALQRAQTGLAAQAGMPEEIRQFIARDISGNVEALDSLMRWAAGAIRPAQHALLGVILGIPVQDCIAPPESQSLVPSRHFNRPDDVNPYFGSKEFREQVMPRWDAAIDEWNRLVIARHLREVAGRGTGAQESLGPREAPSEPIIASPLTGSTVAAVREALSSVIAEGPLPSQEQRRRGKAIRGSTDYGDPLGGELSRTLDWNVIQAESVDHNQEASRDAIYNVDHGNLQVAMERPDDDRQFPALQQSELEQLLSERAHFTILGLTEVPRLHPDDQGTVNRLILGGSESHEVGFMHSVSVTTLFMSEAMATAVQTMVPVSIEVIPVPTITTLITVKRRLVESQRFTGIRLWQVHVTHPDYAGALAHYLSEPQRQGRRFVVHGVVTPTPSDIQKREARLIQGDPEETAKVWASLIKVIGAGQSDSSDRRFMAYRAAMLRPGDRVLHLGSGLSRLPVLDAILGAEHVTVTDRNPALFSVLQTFLREEASLVHAAINSPKVSHERHASSTTGCGTNCFRSLATV